MQLQLKDATFQYQAGTLTSAALRKHPLTIEACAFARAFAEVSRKITHVSERKATPTDIHTLAWALTSQAGYQAVASPGFISTKSKKCFNQRRRKAQRQR